jgi:hypothetical protein
VLTGKRWMKKSPISAGLFMSLVHEASLREPCLPAPPDAVGRVNVVYMAANPREVDVAVAIPRQRLGFCCYDCWIEVDVKKGLSMISTLELRHIIESSFLPQKCICTVNSVGTMTIQLMNPSTNQVDLTVPGIPIASLITMRAVADLVAQVREEHRLVLLSQRDSSSPLNSQG